MNGDAVDVVLGPFFGATGSDHVPALRLDELDAA